MPKFGKSLVGKESGDPSLELRMTGERVWLQGGVFFDVGRRGRLPPLGTGRSTNVLEEVVLQFCSPPKLLRR
jgi:hypothetical protein